MGMTYDRLNNVTSEAVKKATGKTWDEWVDFLDSKGMAGKTHKEMALWLMEERLIESGWWAQSVTLGYEFAKGRRVVGKTLDSGFQIGVQRMIPAPKEKIWSFLQSPMGKRLWTEDAMVEMRSLVEGEKMRMRWQPDGRSTPTTLQISLYCPRNTTEKTQVRIHHEKLGSSNEREKMRGKWKKVLDELTKMVTS